MSAYDAATATCSAWTVVHGPRVAVRGAPSVTAPCVGAKKEGEVVRPIGVVDGWLQLGPREFMLIDGTPLGFGALVEPADATVRLSVRNREFLLNRQHAEESCIENK